MGGVVKAITRPFKAVAKAVTSVVAAPLKLFAPEPKEIKQPEPTPSAPPAPEPESVVEGTVQNENLTRKKRSGRGGLRIDLNTGGSTQSGVNVPRG